jgi:Leucine-rich repeat (LRR) protein
VVVTKPPAPIEGPAIETGPVSPWSVRVRVVAWLPEGEVEVGELPGLTTLPTGPWYVEPIEPLTARTFATLVGIVRSEHVGGLSLRGQAIAGWLDQLQDLPELKALLLDSTDVDGTSIQTLSPDLGIDRLGVARTLVDDAALVWIAANLGDTLLALDLEDTPVTDAGAKTIAAQMHLKTLVLAGTRLTDAGGAALGKLVDLDIIDLGGTEVGAKTIAALRTLHPRQLFIDHTYVGKELATLAPLAPGLIRFNASDLVGYKPSDADVAWLTKAPALVDVGLSGSKVTDATGLPLASLPMLMTVHLAGTSITKATIAKLTALAELRNIDLADTPVDDAAAALLLAKPKLRMLRLDGTWVTDAALAGPVSTVLTELWLSRTAVTDAGLAILDHLPKLEGLGLAKDRIGDPTIARIATLSELRTLVLSKTEASEPALRALAALTKLERLYLDGTASTSQTVIALAPLVDLDILHLTDTNVDDAAVPTLRSFTGLTELAIGSTRIRESITDLDAWPHLRTLSLYGSDTDDTLLPAFARRTSLTALDLSATNVEDPAALLALPNLRTLGLWQVALSASGQKTVKTLAKRGVDVVQ